MAMIESFGVGARWLWDLVSYMQNAVCPVSCFIRPFPNRVRLTDRSISNSNITASDRAQSAY